MPEKHNRILLCPEAEREIKQRIRVRVGEDEKQKARVSHTHMTSFQFLVVLLN